MDGSSNGAEPPPLPQKPSTVEILRNKLLNREGILKGMEPKRGDLPFIVTNARFTRNKPTMYENFDNDTQGQSPTLGSVPDGSVTLLPRSPGEKDDPSPHELGTSPHELGTSLHELGTFPHELGTSPHEFGTSPHELGTSPHELGTSRHQLGTSSPTSHNFCHLDHSVSSSSSKCDSTSSGTLLGSAAGTDPSGYVIMDGGGAATAGLPPAAVTTHHAPPPPIRPPRHTFTAVMLGTQPVNTPLRELSRDQRTRLAKTCLAAILEIPFEVDHTFEIGSPNFAARYKTVTVMLFDDSILVLEQNPNGKGGRTIVRHNLKQIGVVHAFTDHYGALLYAGRTTECGRIAVALKVQDMESYNHIIAHFRTHTKSD